MLNILKGIIFYPLLWLRGLLIKIGRFLAGFLLLAALVTAFLPEIDKAFTTILAVMSFTLFMLCHFYDWVLLKLNPTGHTLILEQ
ncbi:TPA: hypothetical protein ACGTTL_002458 [Vibrio parahaemolyticus]